MFAELLDIDGTVRWKLLLSCRGIVARGCSTIGEAKAKTGTIARIVTGEKCILAKAS